MTSLRRPRVQLHARPSCRLAGALIAVILTSLGSAQTEPDYVRDIAPIFRAYCVSCHNDDDREGELSIETYAQLRAGGERDDPIDPGAPETSFLIRSIEGRARPPMPPKDEPQLPESAKLALRRWVAAGAPPPQKDESLLESFVAPVVPRPRSGSSAITAISYSPDGARLAVARFGRVELCDPVTYRPLERLTGFPGKVNAVQFSGDGHAFAAASGITGLSGEARVYDVSKFDDSKPGVSKPRPSSPPGLRQTFAGHRDTLYDVALSPNGVLLATAGYDRRIRIWRRSDGTLLREIDVHKGAIYDLEFDPSGAVLASASADETVKLWRVADGVRLDTLNQPQGEQYAVAFTPDGQHILSTGADRRIHLWRFVSRTEPALNPVVFSRFAHESAVVALTLARGGTVVVTAAEDRSLTAWSLPELVELASYEAQPDVISAIATLPGTERFLVARLDGSLESYTLPQAQARLRPNDTPLTENSSSPPADVSPQSEQDDQDSKMQELVEAEPNDTPNQALAVTVPGQIKGAIDHPGDADLVRFEAKGGQEFVVEVDAARSKSNLDSKIEILDDRGQLVEQVVLQAVRDSWFTFRGKDSDTSGDFRIHNWREMELNEYLYANGEVVRLWHYPRGPDSGFLVYPGSGKRHTQFATTALSHPLGEPCYIVEPLPPGSTPTPNGLPVFRLYYQNDDDPFRHHGKDSRLHFRAPEDGPYWVRVTDVRDFGDAKGFHYSLTVRPARPDFKVTIGGRDPKISPGSGRELTFTASRIDGFDGEIVIHLDNLPEGFTATTPVTIEAGQLTARGAIYATAAATTPSPEASAAVRVEASARLRGREITRELGDLGAIQVAGAAKLTVEILPQNPGTAARDADGRLIVELRPGETVRARVRAQRHDFGGRIELGSADAGRNLPHGVYVDNIGLNGLLIVEGQTEREFFITGSRVAAPGERLFHLRASADGGQCSAPAVVRVLPKDAERLRRF